MTISVPQLIGLTGRARAGKDTVANILAEQHGYTAVALADPLREAALQLDPLVPCASGVERLSDCVTRLGWTKAKSNPEIRRTLQRLGTEAGWMMHGRDMWVNLTAQRIQEIPGPVVVTDVRFPHEADWLRSVGGVLVSIDRPGSSDLGSNAQHSSEQSQLRSDSVIFNDGSLADLETVVEAAVDALAARFPHACTSI